MLAAKEFAHLDDGMFLAVDKDDGLIAIDTTSYGLNTKAAQSGKYPYMFCLRKLYSSKAFAALSYRDSGLSLSASLR